MTTAYHSDELYDVIVVGASFAGLSFAGAAAVRGLRVLVLERDAAVGGVVRTTGVLFSDVLDWVDVPRRYLMNAVRAIRLQPPEGRAPWALSQNRGLAALCPRPPQLQYRCRRLLRAL